jgi:hypothetical protein
MPGKSKHGKGRRNQYRSTPRQPQTAAAVTNNATAQAGAPAAVAAPKSAPGLVKPAAPSKSLIYKPATTAEYPYFSSELKRIIILTAAVVVVLIVLAFIFK